MIALHRSQLKKLMKCLQAYVARMNRAYPVEFFGDKRRDKNAPRPSGIIA